MFRTKILTLELIVNSELSFYKNMVDSHGWKNTSYFILLNAMNKLTYTKVLTCITTEKVNPKSMIIDPRFAHGFLKDAEVIMHSEDAANELPAAFLQEAMKKGDKCYAITDRDGLAGYGWYSDQPTETDIKKLSFTFDSSYMYMYKGLTKKNYRGQRLHAIGMSWALQRSQELGYKGLVSYVEANNFDSLKSCYRMGYKKVGSILVLNIFGKNILYHSKSCKQHKISLK
jgi:hypothetical protein